VLGHWPVAAEKADKRPEYNSPDEDFRFRETRVEMSLVPTAALLCLAFTGGGALSVDASRQASREEAARGRARLLAKVNHH